MTQDELQYNIHPVYKIPREEISCPSCGRIYGHHKTKVDPISEECSTCALKMGVDKSSFISAEEFINKLLK